MEDKNCYFTVSGCQYHEAVDPKWSKFLEAVFAKHGVLSGKVINMDLEVYVVQDAPSLSQPVWDALEDMTEGRRIDIATMRELVFNNEKAAELLPGHGAGLFI